VARVDVVALAGEAGIPPRGPALRRHGHLAPIELGVADRPAHERNPARELELEAPGPGAEDDFVIPLTPQRPEGALQVPPRATGNQSVEPPPADGTPNHRLPAEPVERRSHNGRAQ